MTYFEERFSICNVCNILTFLKQEAGKMVNTRRGLSALGLTLAEIPLIPIAVFVVTKRIASGAIISGIKGGIKSGLAIQDAAKKIYNEAKAEYEEEKKESQS